MKKISIIFLSILAIAAVSVWFSCNPIANTQSTSSTYDVLDQGDSVRASAVWSSSDNWATWSNGGYTVANDVWGSNPAPETIWANSYSNWGVTTSQTGSGIKSYPHCERAVGKTLSSLGSCTSSFNATSPSGGAWDFAYDIWCNNSTYEIMLWFKWQGTGPIAASYNSNGGIPTVTNVTVGGYTWDVYKGSNGSNAVYSFLDKSQTSSGTVDIKAVLNWIKSEGWFGDVTLTDVQHGWEITNTSGTADFTMNSYSVSFN
jgi:Glycosyl hydrolase family 12